MGIDTDLIPIIKAITDRLDDLESSPSGGEPKHDDHMLVEEVKLNIGIAIAQKEQGLSDDVARLAYFQDLLTKV